MEQVRLAEIVGALSLATDLGMGSPFELGLSTCLVATRLAETLGCGEAEIRRVYWVALLRHVGCTAATHELAALVGDEIAFRRSLSTADGSRTATARAFVSALATGRSLPARLRGLTRMLADAPAIKEASTATCEVADRFTAALGFDEDVRRDVAGVYERWDGKGFPKGVRAAKVGLAPRIVCVAEAGELFRRLEGVEAARAIVKRRAKRAYDPRIAACFAEHADALLAPSQGDAWEAMLAEEPGPQRWVDGEELERALQAVADFADLKSPWLTGHSRGVAELARAAASAAGLDDAAAERVYAAGLVHDVGRVAVSSAIWDREGPLTEAEWERVRLRPATTARVLDRAESLRPVGEVAAALLAAADVFHALQELRPHRPARSRDEAAEELRAEVRAGRLDGDAAEAVLRVVPATRDEAAAAELTQREVEVLRLLARGLTTEQIAAELAIAHKTADAHVEDVYVKAGVTTRAAATVFALQHDLIAPLER
jgi:HD-GYP domain-containing protein (c-di-GMP phosphodiesterase class II)